MTVRIGTNPIGWTNDDLPELGGDTPLEICLSEARAAGFSGIEKGNKFPSDAAALLEVLGRHQTGVRLRLVRCRAAQPDRGAGDRGDAPASGLAACVRQPGDGVRRNLGLGAGAGVFRLAQRPVLREDQWPMVLERVDALAGWMAAQGVRMAFHHHMGTVIEKAHEIDRLMTETEHVGLLLDTGHLAFAGADPAAIARKWAHRINHVHAKDVRVPVLAQALREQWSFLDRCGVASSPFPATAALTSPPRFARSPNPVTMAG